MNVTNLMTSINKTTTDMPFVLPASLSKIKPSDKVLLEQAIQTFRPKSKNYEDSWGYIIQATRYDGFKWYDAGTGSLIFFGRKSKDDNTIVVANFFASPKYLASVLSTVQSALNAPQIILKNINPEEIAQFASYGFRPYKETESWNEEARFDDQTYPQQIINLKSLANPQGKKYHQLKRILNKEPNVSIRKYEETDMQEVLDIFALKDGTAVKASEEEKRAGMYYVSHEMYPTAEVDKFIITNNKNGKIIGFTATSNITSENTTLVASLFTNEVKYASVWGIYQTLLYKYQEGFKIANLGGCETEGTYIFLRRTFRHAAELEKTHLIYDPFNY
jgi:hypothetical protein